MRKLRLTVFYFLLLAAAFQLNAQTNTDASAETAKPNFPQWAKDLRRFDIIAFGSFPFAMFTSTFFNDLYRWNQANGLDFSEQGRRYAPWPIKSAGAVEMTKEEFERTIFIAAGISVTVALVDFAIVKFKAMRERRRIENMPAGTAIITVKPIVEAVEEETGAEEAEPETE